MKRRTACILVLLTRIASAQGLPPGLAAGEISPANSEVLAERDRKAPLRAGVPLMLTGQHRFQTGDDPGWASPEYDDSCWPSTLVPGSWPTGSFWTSPVGWYRIHFFVPEGWGEEPAGVALGPIAYADETFLNGIRIGGIGRVGADFVEAPLLERLYPVPPDVLRWGADNVLAVRGQFPSGGGIVRGPLAMGNLTALDAQRRRRELGGWIVETMFLTFYGLVLACCLFCYSRRIWDAEYVRFGIMVTCYVAVFFLESHTCHALGWKTPWAMRCYALLVMSLPAAALPFFASVTRARPPRVLWVVVCAPLLIGAANLVTADFWTLGDLAIVLCCAMLAGAGAVIVWWCAQAVRHRLPDSGLLSLGASGAILGEALSLAGPVPLGRLGGVYTSHFGIAFFVLCSMFLLANRFHRTQQRLREVSGRVLEAHTEERKRLARDLHDGVLQSVLAIHLNLKMAHAAESDPARRQALAELSQETAGAIEELRRVATSLRPAALEKLGLAQAVRWFVGAAQAHTGLAIEVHTAIRREPAPATTDHLCRILQETLNNVHKHAAAHRGTVTVSGSDGRLKMEVTDDGQGFDVAEQERKGEGLGLFTIRERAQLLGGQVQIASRPGKGTTVSVMLEL